MVIIMMFAGAPPVGGFAARKSLAVAQSALPKTGMGHDRAQQQDEHQAENEKTFVYKRHKNVVVHRASFGSRLSLPSGKAGALLTAGIYAYGT